MSPSALRTVPAALDSADADSGERVSGVQLVVDASQREGRSLAGALLRACGASEAPEARVWSIRPVPRTMFVATGEFSLAEMLAG